MVRTGQGQRKAVSGPFIDRPRVAPGGQAMRTKSAATPAAQLSLRPIGT